MENKQEKVLEAFLIFIYKTIKAYSQYQEFIEEKLQGKYVNKKIMNGYLISSKYFDYWRKFSDYDDLKDKVIMSKDYNSIKKILYQYRKSNKYQKYQSDAVQIKFKSPEELYDAVKRQDKSFVLIDSNFWKLICTQEGLNERGNVSFSLDKDTITLYFNEYDYCHIITNDNIIDSSKEMKSTGAEVIRQSDKEERELEKLFI